MNIKGSNVITSTNILIVTVPKSIYRGLVLKGLVESQGLIRLLKISSINNSIAQQIIHRQKWT